MRFRVLYQDAHLIAIDKPAGFQVHQPEDKQHRVAKIYDCLNILRDQTGSYLYPVHRLDRATSGVLIYALSSEAARKTSAAFVDRTVHKIYYCVTRGWVAEEGEILSPLDGKDAHTIYERVATVELPHAVGKYPSARYSLVRVFPRTGKMHQIRRHFARLSHPLIGDTIYGDGDHNRFFRDTLGMRNLLLKAYSLELPHPETALDLRIRARWNKPWHQLFEIFGVCPL